MTITSKKKYQRLIPTKKKSILSFTNILSILLLYSSCVGVDLSDKNDPKPEKIVLDNQALLELSVQNLFDHTWSETQVNAHLKANKISAQVNFVDIKHQVVIFFVNGMIDNCIGFGYSTGQHIGHLCDGNTSWGELIAGNWYIVSSI